MTCWTGRCWLDPDMQRIAAVSIARPLADDLAGRSWLGYVVGVFSRACYIGGPDGRIVALTLAEAGRGPFSIAIKGRPGLFAEISAGLPARAHGRSLQVGNWEITWDTAGIWEPGLVGPAGAVKLGPGPARLLREYAGWSFFPASTSLPGTAGAERLGSAVVDSLVHHRPDRLAEAVAGLVGLGRGLTPAGDDFLVGVMAALWLTGQAELLADIVTAAAAKTTRLSAAYLRAAARGEFAEPWHDLALALRAADTAAAAEAVDRIAGTGASSGRDALAGFAGTMLAFYGPEHVPSFRVIDPD